MRLASNLALGLLLAFGSSGLAKIDGPDLNELRSALANSEIPVEERSRRALEGVTALDLAAQQAVAPQERRSRWDSAVSLIDGFLASNPDVESAPLLRFQSGVYRWAMGRSFAEQVELSPSDKKARGSASQALDDAVGRLREVKIKPEESKEVFAQNVRFRLAQALADRARLDPEDGEGRLSAEREALGLLDASLTATDLRPFAALLRADLSNRLRLFGQALMEIEQAEKLKPGLAAGPLLEVKVAALVGRSQNEEARKAVEAAKIPEPLKKLLTLRILLARRHERGPGAERSAIDAEAFRVAEGLRGSNRAEDRKGLMELARSVDEPGEEAPPEWWDLLAEGHLRLGEIARSGRLESKGADRAKALGQPEKAASLHHKAGAYLFEAGKFAEADAEFSRVLEGDGAPRDLKARAGMLRALARGRAVAVREPGASMPAYLAALEGQIRDYPNDPTTGEARWLLGQLRMTAGRPDEAVELWSKIAHGHPRWLDARQLVDDRLREQIEVQRLNRDTAAISAKMELARKSLRAALDEANEGPESVNLTLKLAQLELIPDAGKPALALEACDRLLKAAARPEQHKMARLLRMVALARSNRWGDAEQIARAEARDVDVPAALPALRLMDRSAAEVESENTRRRFGLVTRYITARIVEHLDQIPAKNLDEARLRHARAALFAGDLTAAKREIMSWGPVQANDDEFLRDLADTYQRLDAYGLAVDAERYRSSRLTPGSLPWFDSRYGMALAYYRDGKKPEARQIIDSTVILHPDLGGGDLRARFDQLRRRIDKD